MLGVRLTRPETRQQVLQIAEGIVGNTIDPYKGARRIWGLLARDGGDYPDDLITFVGMASEWEDHPEHREAYEADILAEARLLLDRRASDG